MKPFLKFSNPVEILNSGCLFIALFSFLDPQIPGRLKSSQPPLFDNLGVRCRIINGQRSDLNFKSLMDSSLSSHTIYILFNMNLDYNNILDNHLF